jgi:hypothetical protein
MLVADGILLVGPNSERYVGRRALPIHHFDGQTPNASLHELATFRRDVKSWGTRPGLLSPSAV